MYAKEEYDPIGDQVLYLSHLLNNCGIYCDIDLYHPDNVMDWLFWVGNNLKNYPIILVCSPTMISTLEEGNESAHIGMVAGHIESKILKQHLQQGTDNVLPLFINDPSPDYMPPSLAGKTCYNFPYDKLSEMPEDQVIDHHDFATLKDLVTMMTGQQEIVVPDGSQGKYLQ